MPRGETALGKGRLTTENLLVVRACVRRVVLEESNMSASAWFGAVAPPNGPIAALATMMAVDPCSLVGRPPWRGLARRPPWRHGARRPLVASPRWESCPTRCDGHRRCNRLGSSSPSRGAPEPPFRHSSSRAVVTLGRGVASGGESSSTDVEYLEQRGSEHEDGAAPLRTAARGNAMTECNFGVRSVTSCPSSGRS
jgi:hypothetical protein